ncbi:hypothetical protein MVEN_00238900 [Mycena venus]|uniref:Fruit-body specific protein a n=1 Tax=Mycena venus TaxID=2733690 RepID=A0A8H7DDM5_9AGAR|nr:hypothetical protein MVEN_00238900 [Mycena venus]
MRFSTVFSALAVVATGATGVSAVTSFSANSITTALGLTAQNYYGAPTPPWKPNHKPGWYYGKGTPPQGVFCVLEEVRSLPFDMEQFTEPLFPADLRAFGALPILLAVPQASPASPRLTNLPPPPKYSQTFYNLTCAAQDDSYQTYGLVDTVADCQAMCDSVSGCTFFNTYHDVNGKNGSPQLTCALFQKCLTADSADNCGGQTQPDGSVDFITNSDGYCKTA